MSGNISKSKITKEEQAIITVIEESGSEIVSVNDIELGNGIVSSINCIFVKKMNRSLMESPEFPIAAKKITSNGIELNNINQTAVDEGIRIGTVLGKKLQVRSESRDTVYNRQRTGKLDKRLISNLGYGSPHVFYTKDVDKYGNANLHISIDASSSMGQYGKWKRTLTNVVGLAKAVDMIPNLEIQISIRTTSSASSKYLPYVLIAYDSRVDKFTKVKQLFPYLIPNGTTPEGLCFDPIIKTLVNPTTDTDSYFVNISDGEPFYSNKVLNYQGLYAARHTKSVVNKIDKMGIKIISYYVGSGTKQRVFDESYGSFARYIDIVNINEISKTMNKMFLEKK